MIARFSPPPSGSGCRAGLAGNRDAAAESLLPCHSPRIPNQLIFKIATDERARVPPRSGAARRVPGAPRAAARGAGGTGFPGSAKDVPEDEIVALLRQNRKIEAVKLYCEVTGAGLSEAASAVDLIESNYLSGG